MTTVFLVAGVAFFSAFFGRLFADRLFGVKTPVIRYATGVAWNAGLGAAMAVGFGL